jgi:hypothetical protein
MNILDLCDYMTHSKAWAKKELLFMSVFPNAEDRVEYIGDFTHRLIEAMAIHGMSTNHLNDLVLRKKAIERWFRMLPESVTTSIDLSDPDWVDPMPPTSFEERRWACLTSLPL